MRARFDDCEVDFGTREIFRKGRPVHLSPKAFLLLEFLFISRPQALSKAAIHEKIWPESFVSESTLASLIAEIRAAIGDSGERALLRTIHGFGYAFSGPVTEKIPSARTTLVGWRVIDDGREVALVPGENLLGRDATAAIRIDLESVSRRHARILVTGETAAVEDLGSKNGTLLRGRRLKGIQPLRDGDEIRIGAISLRVRRWDPDSPTKTEVRG